MSDKNQDYWKELMGEDFKVDPLESPGPVPEKPAAGSIPPASPLEPVSGESEDNKPKSDPGFTIEYVSLDGSVPASAPDPVQPEPEALGPEPVRPQVPEWTSVPEFDREPSGPSELEDGPESMRPRRPAEPQRPMPARPSSPARGKKDRGRDDFEVEFDFDAQYPDVDEKAVRRGRTKRTGCLTGILLFLFVISVSVVLAYLGWNWATDVLGLDGGEDLVEVTLPKDIFHEEKRTQKNEEGEEVEVTVNVVDVDAVAEELYQKGLIRYKWLFKLFSSFAHGDTKVRPGTYNLKMNYDYRALINGMNPRTGIRNIVKITIPEGYTISQIVALMEENGVCEQEDLLDSLANTDFEYDFLDSSTLGDPKRLEGYLFPDTYEFYENDDPDSVIKRFLNNFKRKWEDDFDQKADALGYSMHDILIVASMIEKEAGADAERASIASVIYNRLADTSGKHGTNGYLQVDATIRYIIADTGEKFSTEIDSPYNTYLYPGLPAGPIANPGLASIRAALEPASTKYYYYALSKSGVHKFFETLNEHTNFVNSDQYGG